MVFGVVPARGGSKGLPGKNLRPLGGVPLVVHTIRAARASRELGDFVVSTDDDEIAAVARSAGADVPFRRPAELSGDAVANWPVARHAVAAWEAAGGARPDVIVLLQPTSPLRTGADIDGCVRRLLELDADVCVSVRAAHDSPYFNLVEVVPGTEPFARPCSPLMVRSVSRRQDVPAVYALNGAAYAVRRERLDAIESQFEFPRLALYEMPWERSVDIDTAEDLELAEWLLARRGLRGPRAGGGEGAGPRC